MPADHEEYKQVVLPFMEVSQERRFASSDVQFLRIIRYHRKSLKFFFEPADLEAAINSEGDWKTVGEQILRMKAQGQLGEAMWAEIGEDRMGTQPSS